MYFQIYRNEIVEKIVDNIKDRKNTTPLYDCIVTYSYRVLLIRWTKEWKLEREEFVDNEKAKVSENGEEDGPVSR